LSSSRLFDTLIDFFETKKHTKKRIIMVTKFTFTLFFTASLLVSGLAQSSDTTQPMSVETLHQEFLAVRASLGDSIPLGITDAVKCRQQLTGSTDLFLLDDANRLLLGCIAIEDSLRQMRETIDAYKVFADKSSHTNAFTAKQKACATINMPKPFSIAVLSYEQATQSQLEAINSLNKRRKTMQFILRQMRINISRANELLAYGQIE
jgi:hypothetical protein